MRGLGNGINLAYPSASSFQRPPNIRHLHPAELLRPKQAMCCPHLSATQDAGASRPRLDDAEDGRLTARLRRIAWVELVSILAPRALMPPATHPDKASPGLSDGKDSPTDFHRDCRVRERPHWGRRARPWRDDRGVGVSVYRDFSSGSIEHSAGEPQEQRCGVPEIANRRGGDGTGPRARSSRNGAV